MSKMLMILIGMLLSGQAFAYAEKTYECENRLGLPKNTYKIQNIDLNGAAVPFVEIHRFYRAVAGDANSAVQESVIKGFATVSSYEPGKETLLLAAIRLDFDHDTLFNCQ